MYAHDHIASKEYEPQLSAVPHEVDEDEEAVKIVRLIKSDEPLVSSHNDKKVVL